MKRELNEIFNKEVDRYRNALLFYAKQCQWDTFKANAGRLFDYVESIEMSEIERRFFNISKIIVAVISALIVVILKLDITALPEITGLKQLIILVAIGICGFEIFFFLNFKVFKKHKAAFYKKRRERFIVGIERDFKNIAVQEERHSVELERNLKDVTVHS
jgi:hypothetical protein